MNEENIPAKLRHLIPAVAKYGIGDDFIRDANIDRQNDNELRQLIQLLEENENEISNWLFGGEMNKNSQNQEYVNFTNFTMSVDMARAILGKRENRE